jgi:serine/threonine-protein kinase
VDFAKMQDIFLAAVEGHRPEDWGAYLDEACGADDELRHQVNLLLKAHREAGSVPGTALRERDQTGAYQTLTEAAGTVIGPYKLMEQIGEGGMGLVFVAERQQPVRRRVALKVIKPGMDTRQVIARFEAERQALALMDHPNIAQVHDGGTTPTGRPYFVMELVKGVPITEYCDHNQVPIRERLELFLQVCQAVQHAHQKGIIHRDL